MISSFRLPFFLLGSFILLVMPQLQAEAPYSDPKNTGQWILAKEVSDEFNGEFLDTEKWWIQGAHDHYENRWRGRAPSQFSPDNVALEDGHLVITSKWDETFSFSGDTDKGGSYGIDSTGRKVPVTTAAVITKKQFRYGYLEVRAQAANGPVSSSFWTTGKGGELDVFEHYGENPENEQSAKRYHTSFHDWRVPVSRATYGKRVWTNEHYLPFRVADDFHVYGLEWHPDYLKIYIDGRLIRFVTKEEIGDSWVVDAPQKIWLDSELFPWELPATKTTKDLFPKDGCRFMIDYVRVWQNGESGGAAPPAENLVKSPSLDGDLSPWVTRGNAKIDSSGKGRNERGYGQIMAGTTGAIEQQVALEPNTSYILSARVRCPDTDNVSAFHDGWMGVKSFGGSFTSTRFFQPEWHRKSIQFKTGMANKSAVIFFTNQWSKEHAQFDSVEITKLPDRDE